MKKIVLLLIFIFNISDLIPSPDCCAFYSIPEKVKGGYRKCEVHSYSDGFFSWKYEGISSISYYDSLGNTIEKINYNKNATINSQTQFEYNTKNMVIKETRIRNNHPVIETSFYYDKKDSIIEVINYSYQTQDTNREKYKYSESGKILEIIGYKNNKIDYRHYYSYDLIDNNNEIIYFNYSTTIRNRYEHDLLIESTKYDINNKVRSSDLFEYNDCGLKTEHLQKNSNGVTIASIIYRYDQNNNLIQYISSNDEEDEINEQWERQFDEFGNITEEIIYRDSYSSLGKITKKYVYIYSK